MADLGHFWGPLGATLDPSWPDLASSWDRLGASRGGRGDSWDDLGAIFAESWADLERILFKYAVLQKALKFQRKHNDFSFQKRPEKSQDGSKMTFGPLLGCSGSLLGRSWRLLDRSWWLLSRSWPGLRASWLLLSCSWLLLGRSWPLLGCSWPLLGRS
jgi:hypothetical protein